MSSSVQLIPTNHQKERNVHGFLFLAACPQLTGRPPREISFIYYLIHLWQLCTKRLKLSLLKNCISHIVPMYIHIWQVLKRKSDPPTYWNFSELTIFDLWQVYIQTDLPILTMVMDSVQLCGKMAKSKAFQSKHQRVSKDGEDKQLNGAQGGSNYPWRLPHM